MHQHISKLVNEQKYLLANIDHYKKASHDLMQEISEVCKKTLENFKARVVKVMKYSNTSDRVNALRNLINRFLKDVGRINKKSQRIRRIYEIRLIRFETCEKKCSEKLEQKRKELQELRHKIYEQSRSKLIVQLTSADSAPQNRL